MMTEIVGSAALRRVRGDRDADETLGFQAQMYDKVIAFGGRAQVPGWGRVWNIKRLERTRRA
jgi:hypothetical protein